MQYNVIWPPKVKLAISIFPHIFQIFGQFPDIFPTIIVKLSDTCRYCREVVTLILTHSVANWNCH